MMTNEARVAAVMEPALAAGFALGAASYHWKEVD